MKTLPPGLSAHVAGEATTLSRCWKLMRRDGTILGFTDHDRDLSFDGTVFEAATGFRASETEQSLGLSVESQDILGALRSDRVSADDIRGGRYDGGAVEVWTVNWLEPAERLLEQVFTIGEIREEDGAFRVELRSLASDMDETRGRRFLRTCDADLGYSRCGVDLVGAGFTFDVAIDAVEEPDTLVVDALNALPANWFRGGRIAFTSGANQGLAVEIGEHFARNGRAVLRLWKPMPFPVAAGDTATITAGCDKSFATCRAKFANGVNFRGFPHIPGNDFALSYANGFRVMDGGPLVP